VEIDAVPGVNGNNRAYNRNGNLTQNETGDLYEFDYANKLVKVSTKDANNLPIDVVFTYDCTGRKIQKTVTQTNTNTVVVDEHYCYSGEEVIAEYNASDVLLRSYVLGERIDIPVVLTEGAFDFYFVYDTHGSVIAITNATGAIEERYKYDAHGNFEILIDSAFVSNRYFYTARDWEAEIKLYHNRARFYDPQNGFFIQRDPLGYVDGSNPYVYTSGNSINYFDPLGLNESRFWRALQGYDDYVNGTIRGFGKGTGKFVAGTAKGVYKTGAVLGGNLVNAPAIIITGKPVFEGAAESAVSFENATQKMAQVAVYAYDNPTEAAKKTFDAADAGLNNWASGSFEERLTSSWEVGLGVITAVAPAAKGSGIAKVDEFINALKLEKAAPATHLDDAAPVTNKIDEVIETAQKVEDISNKPVLLDSNVTLQLKKDPTLNGRLNANETPIISHVTTPELRNVVSKGKLQGLPKALELLESKKLPSSVDLRIYIRGMIKSKVGKFGDGIIGAQALENKIPLITNDKELKRVVQLLGGEVR